METGLSRRTLLKGLLLSSIATPLLGYSENSVNIPEGISLPPDGTATTYFLSIGTWVDFPEMVEPNDGGIFLDYDSSMKCWISKIKKVSRNGRTGSYRWEMKMEENPSSGPIVEAALVHLSGYDVIGVSK